MSTPSASGPTTERFHVLAQLEHLQSRYTGTGHADMNRWEWITNQHRDTYGSIIGEFPFRLQLHNPINLSVSGHPDHLSYVAIAENETRARTRFNLLCRMIQPCGPPPEKSPLDEL